jgi:rhodanese-related sulfurtransferase
MLHIGHALRLQQNGRQLRAIDAGAAAADIHSNNKKEQQDDAHLALRRPVAMEAPAVVSGVLLLSWAGGTGVRMPQDTLLMAVEQGAAPHILDVITIKEYTAGHVPGAIHIPYHTVWWRHSALAAGKTDLIIVYCSHGLRAGMGKLQLRALCYEKVVYL